MSSQGPSDGWPPSQPNGWLPADQTGGWGQATPPPPPTAPYTPYGGTGYGVPGYGQPAYAPPGYGYPMARDHPDATTVLICGILGLVMCAPIGTFAWVRGSRVLKEIDASPGTYTNRGTVQAGRICGIIASVLMIVQISVGVLFIIAALAGNASSNG